MFLSSTCSTTCLSPAEPPSICCHFITTLVVNEALGKSGHQKIHINKVLFNMKLLVISNLKSSRPFLSSSMVASPRSRFERTCQGVFQVLMCTHPACYVMIGPTVVEFGLFMCGVTLL